MMEGSRDRTAISNQRMATAGDGRKRKRGAAAMGEEGRPSPSTQWRTEAEQKNYTSKLLDALRRVRGADPHGGAAAAAPPRSHAFREAADRALAVAARGRTRWSRALLSSRAIVIKARRRRPPAPPRTKSAAASAPPPGGRSKKTTPALRRKAMVLGCLVPGCRKLSFPSLLEETTDYIAALEMQVRAMAALAEILSSAGASPASTSGGGDASRPDPQPPA